METLFSMLLLTCILWNTRSCVTRSDDRTLRMSRRNNRGKLPHDILYKHQFMEKEGKIFRQNDFNKYDTERNLDGFYWRINSHSSKWYGTNIFNQMISIRWNNDSIVHFRFNQFHLKLFELISFFILHIKFH